MTYRRLLRRQPLATQQPDWPDPRQLGRVRDVLTAANPLVSSQQISALRRELERVAAGEALILQAGDCAEHPGECGEPFVAERSALVHQLAGLLGARSGRPVVRVGRIAGQYAKPRSQPMDELSDGSVLPAYRGHMVNAPECDAHSRVPDPLRMLMCFAAADETFRHLGWRAASWAERDQDELLWTSHEALLMDYERPQLRRDGRRRWFLSSTHWPWIGERTRQPEGAHVRLLSRLLNPVSCKIGPSVTPPELLELCRRLDPLREPGRLTLVVRMGADDIADRLPALARAVRDDGHPVLWLCDPLHGNTVKSADGKKVRVVATVVEEVRRFLGCLDDAGVRAHGLHLEASPYAVTECVGGPVDPLSPAGGAPSLCDPRLGREQAAEVVAAWSGASGTSDASVPHEVSLL